MQVLTRKVVVAFLAAAFVMIVAIFAVYYLVVFRVFEPPTTAAELGEAFGAAGTLLSALSLAGVLAALLLQITELSLQSRELHAVQKEMSRTAAAQEGQRAALLELARAQLSTAQLNAVAPLMELAYQRVRRCEERWGEIHRRLADFREVHKDDMETHTPKRQERIKDEEELLARPAREARRELDASLAELRRLEARANEFIASADGVIASGGKRPVPSGA